MERWLTKPRVLLALSGFMLAAALNQANPLLYGMFLFLLVLSLLGLALPWASMRRVTVQASGHGEVHEDEPAAMALTVEQLGWWPVVMLEVQSHWAWAGQRIVLRHSVPLLRHKRPKDLGSQVRFPCRGLYRLTDVRLTCGFPLGLFTASRNRSFADVAFVVLPRPIAIELPDDLPVSADERGTQVTRRLGSSNELGLLRDYEVGDPVGRIHWRASARAGHLVTQHHLQSGSPLIRLVVEIPGPDAVGRPGTPAEQAVRVAAGWCVAARAAGIRLSAYLPPHERPLSDADDALTALAVAAPASLPLDLALARATSDLKDGEQLVVVVAGSTAGAALRQVLATIALPPWQVLVCVALDEVEPATGIASTPPLLDLLQQAGYHVLPIWR